MPEVTESITIDVPGQTVWDFITEPENNLLVSSNLEEFEQVGEDPVGVGTRFQGIVKVAGRKLSWSNEVAVYDEPKAFHTRSVESPIDFTYDTDLEPDGDGTKVTVHQDIGSFGGFFGKLADPIVLRMYRRDVRANLEKMKELLEG
ncbi:MAG TPA: SRPBCC family protein [Nitriliruptorales bacterium]